MHETHKNAVNYWCEIGLADFASCVLDDYKIVYRFDSCITHEALKDLNDPDIAYLCSCYIGDVSSYHWNDTTPFRRTQTLHHGDFCDELYWNRYVYSNPEQPSLEFTRNIGKEMKNGREKN